MQARHRYSSRRDCEETGILCVPRVAVRCCSLVLHQTHGCLVHLCVPFFRPLHYMPVLRVANHLEASVQPAAGKPQGPRDVANNMYCKGV